jgi:hypothetical protein
MTAVAWPLVELASRLLEPDEREAVLGDLLEAEETAWQALLDIFGLVLRRQAFHWKSPQPWFAGFSVALPCTYLLMHVSVSVTATYERLFHHRVSTHWPTGQEGFVLLCCHFFLLMAWSWAGGYVVGSASRRTLWLSIALSSLACAFCLVTFRFAPLSRFCSFLFLLPAILGVRHGVRNARFSFACASLLAVTVTLLMIFAWAHQALWVLNWVLVLPAWYLVAAAWRSRQEGRTGPSWPFSPAPLPSPVPVHKKH